MKGISKSGENRWHTLQRLSADLGKRAQPYPAEVLRSAEGPPGEWGSHGCTASWAPNSTVSSRSPGQVTREPRPTVRSIGLGCRHLQQNSNSRWETFTPEDWENKTAKILHGLETGDSNAWGQSQESKPSGSWIQHLISKGTALWPCAGYQVSISLLWNRVRFLPFTSH